MLSALLFFAFVILVAALLAKVEIQIEGPHGYAEKLPVTWRATRSWVKRFFTGTSYHLYMGLFLAALVHLPFFAGLDWSLKSECLVLGFLSFITVAEDFLWFVLNPAYSLKRYKRNEIGWFRDDWFWFCPIWYWWYIPIGACLYAASQLL